MRLQNTQEWLKLNIWAKNMSMQDESFEEWLLRISHYDLNLQKQILYRTSKLIEQLNSH